MLKSLLYVREVLGSVSPRRVAVVLLFPRFRMDVAYFHSLYHLSFTNCSVMRRYIVYVTDVVLTAYARVG